MTITRSVGVAAAVWLLMTCTPGRAEAQQRPLVTEDPESIGAGRIMLEAGFDWGQDETFPASGLSGNLWRMPTVGVSFGISSIAELQIDTGYQWLSIDERQPAPFADLVEPGDSTSAVLDVVVATKVRFVSESGGRPGFAVRFATKLPNASNESGLGLDTTDFLATLLVGKTAGSVRIVGNIGMGILGDPTRGDKQNDVLLYGVSVARAFTERAELVGELNGRAHTAGGEAPPGTESRGQVRFGGRYTRGAVRFDAALVAGLTSDDASIGFSTGLTYVFNAFKVP
jgi:hypothetical protein